MPRVSVVMSVYNREKTLPYAIQSVLDQTYEDFELIVVDDGSTDASSDVVLSFDDARIRLIQLPENKGVPVARNKGNAAARGDYIVIADSDDYNLPERIAISVEYLDTHPEIDVVYGGGYVTYPDLPGSPTKVYEATPFDRFVFLNSPKNLFFHSTVTHRKSVWDRINYREHIYAGSDYVLFAEMAMNGVNFHRLRAPLIRYTRHQKSLSGDHRPEQMKSGEVVKNLLSALPKYKKDALTFVKEKWVHDNSCLISIIVPTYNNPEELRRVLEALSKQTLTTDNYEVLVTDDGSSDDTLTVVKENWPFQIRYYWHPDRGYCLVNSRNSGLDLANGDIIAILDSDMIPCRDYLQACLRAHAGCPALLAVGGRQQELPDGSILPEDRDLTQPPYALLGGGNCSFRKSTGESIGYFDPMFNGQWGAEDTEWAIRAYKQGVQVMYVKDMLATHIGRKTFQKQGRNQAYMRLKHKKFFEKK